MSSSRRRSSGCYAACIRGCWCSRKCIVLGAIAPRVLRSHPLFCYRNRNTSATKTGAFSLLVKGSYVKYGATAEIDSSFSGRQFNTISNEVSKTVSPLLLTGPLKKIDWELIYCPILMNESNRLHYPPRPRIRKTKKIISVCEQLDYDRYISGNLAERRMVYIEGHLAAIPLMGKSPFPKEAIEYFEKVIREVLAGLSR